MIAEARHAVAVALAVAVDPVPVLEHVPETAAAPCVWLALTEWRFTRAEGWSITFEATCVADAASAPAGAQVTLDELADKVSRASIPGVPTERILGRGNQTVRVGDVQHPAAVVTIPATDMTC